MTRCEIVCLCPICKKGYICSFKDDKPIEPYFHLIPVKLQCNHCGITFNKVLVGKKGKLKAYEKE